MLETTPVPVDARRRRALTHPILTWVVAAVLAVASSLWMWHRLGWPTRGIAWAEDSGVFLNERLELGAVPSLLHPYSGYLHLVPRIVVDAAVALWPIQDYAMVVTALSCCVIGIVSATVFVLARDVVRSAPLRALLAVVPAIAPMGVVEIAGNTANLHWYLLFLAPWVFAFRPRSWWSSASLAVAALAITLTEIQAALFVPLFLFGFRSRRGVPVVAAAFLGLAAQAATTLQAPRPRTPSDASPLDIAAGFLAQPVAGSWNGDVREVGVTIVHLGWWVVVVPAVVVLAVLVLGLVRRRGASRWMIVALGAAPAVLWVAALRVNAVPSMFAEWNEASFQRFGPYRYAAAASMFLLAAVVVTADVCIGRGRVVLPVLGWVLVASVVAAGVLNVHAETRRVDGPVWSTQVQRQGAAVCSADPDGTVRIEASPRPRLWTAEVPCARLEH